MGVLLFHWRNASRWGHFFDENEDKMAAKWSQNGCETGSRGVQTAIGREVGCQSGFGSHFGGMLPSLWLHFGRQMGAKLEPKVVKTAIKNASAFEVDFEMHF